MKDKLILNLFTPEKIINDIECDTVRLTIAEDCKGGFSGSYGIKKGHAPAVFSLGEGVISCFSAGKVVFEVKASRGFASVKDNVVNVTVDSIVEENK